jgi:hypothetical protein
MGQSKQSWLPCCKEATMLAEQQLQQQPLTLLQRMGLRLHLLYCVFCRRYVKQSRNINQYLGEVESQRDVALDESVKLKWELLIAEKLKK